MPTVLTRWHWETQEEDSPYWHIPRGYIGLIDLRTRFQSEQFGGTPQGYAIANYREAPIGSFWLADTFNEPMPLSRRRGMAQELGFGLNDLDSESSVAQCLWKIITAMGDPTGLAAKKPHLPTSGLLINCRIYGWPTRSERFDPTLHPRVFEIVRSDYQAQKAFDLERGNDHYKRVLDGYCLKYRTNPEGLGLEGEERFPRATVIKDDFIRVDADALGSSSEGWSWTETVGDIDILNNKAHSPGGQNSNVTARAESDLSSDDHKSEADLTWVISSSLNLGCAVRYHGTNEDYYECQGSANGDTQKIFKVIGGTRTELDTVAHTIGAETLHGSMEADGSDLEGIIDTTTRNISNSDITGNLRSGIYGFSSNVSTRHVEWKDWQCADVAAAAFTPKVIVY